MVLKKLFFIAISVAVCFSCSRHQYMVSDIKAGRYAIVPGRESQANPEIKQTIAKYKELLDREMNQVIGVSKEAMTYERPESLLTNFTSDVMLDYVRNIKNIDCDLALMNVHGHRSTMPEGDITVGNIYEIYSFENALVLVRIKGKDLSEVFNSYARIGGAGLSSTARLTIKNGNLVKATVNGLPIDNDKIYTLVTLDYLAEGNDGMEGLKNSVDITPLGITLRDTVLEYIKEQTKQGKVISSRLDGRITVEN